MTPHRTCEVCGKDLYRKKVWERIGKRLICFTCGVTHTFHHDGTKWVVRRRDETPPRTHPLER